MCSLEINASDLIILNTHSIHGWMNSYRLPRCTLQHGLETVRSHRNSCFTHLTVTPINLNGVRAYCPRATQQPIRIPWWMEEGMGRMPLQL
jgi:hypothetical protein